MTNKHTQFLVGPSIQGKNNLLKIITEIGILSSSFINSWFEGNDKDVARNSHFALKNLDNITNELLRHRDSKRNLGDWSKNPLKLELEKNVGFLLNLKTGNEKNDFYSLAHGYGPFPNDNLLDLTLEVALNKLKHRSTDQKAVNFSISNNPNSHVLYIFTTGVGKISDTICSINIKAFCHACNSAVNAIP